MSERRRIGILGGTFDPVHNTHLAIARAARDQAGLDLVLFVVSARPPHKENGASATAAERFAMVERALEFESGLEPCRIELDREGPSYMTDTLHELHARYPGAELFLVVGMDTMVDIPHWRDPEGILSQCFILAIPRPGDYTVPPSLEGHYRLLDFDECPLSSTELRRLIEQGQAGDALLPGAVAEFIREKGLYT